MKGFELVKREDHWALYNEDGHKIAATIDGCNSKLSIQNCEAIANGYDLDELAEKHYNGHIKRGHTEEDSLQRKIDFTIGFVSALEILGDKKFSEEDIDKAFDSGYEMLASQKKYNDVLQEFKQSLQQTEWDVEIEMFTSDDLKSVEDDWVKLNKPQLDADSCLILKRI